jgi:hypothetical protein
LKSKKSLVFVYVSVSDFHRTRPDAPPATNASKDLLRPRDVIAPHWSVSSGSAFLLFLALKINTAHRALTIQYSGFLKINIKILYVY